MDPKSEFYSNANSVQNRNKFFKYSLSILYNQDIINISYPEGNVNSEIRQIIRNNYSVCLPPNE